MEPNKQLVFLLTTFNFCLYSTRAILAGYIINALVEGTNLGWSHSEVTNEFLLLTLIACCVGAGASSFGLVYIKEWNDIARIVAIGMGLMAFFLDLLVVGYGGKQWNLGAQVNGEDLEGRLTFLGIASCFEAATVLAFVSWLFMAPHEKATTARVPEDGGETDLHHEEEEDPVEKNSA